MTDEPSLAAAIDRFRGPLVGLIASWGVSVADAAELAQEAFAEAYLSREQCRGDLADPAVVGRWLRGVARMRFRNWRRSKTRREKRVATVDPASLAYQAAVVQPGEDDQLDRLRAAIDRLPERRRQVVLMHYLEETPVRDVAALLSVSEKTVEGRLYQARKQLRRLLEGAPNRAITRALLL